MRQKVVFSGIILVVLIAALFLWMKWDAIFQRGNPIPYLCAVVQLSEEKTYAAVDEAKGIFISKTVDYRQLFADFEQKHSVEFMEQAGSGYVFSDGETRLVISSEIYWGRYQVWIVP